MIFVAGTSGTVGRIVSEFFTSRGIEFKTIKREPHHSHSLIKLISQESEKLSRGNSNIIIYLGLPQQPRSSETWDNHVLEVEKILDIAVSRGFVFVFASSLSAHQGNKSIYSGRKLELEKLVLSRGGRVVRFGVVESDRSDSTFAAIKRILPILDLLSLTNEGAIYYRTSKKHIHEWLMSLLEPSSEGRFDSRRPCSGSERLTYRSLFYGNVPSHRDSKPQSTDIRFMNLIVGKGTIAIMMCLHGGPIGHWVDPWVNFFFGMQLEADGPE